MKKLLKGGSVVSGAGIKRADVLIEGEKITRIGRKLEADSDTQVVDVTGCFLFPGFIDAHTHFDLDVCNTTTADDFYTGSRAALKGGTDRVVLCHNHPNGVALPSREDIQATENIVRALGLVHVLLRDHIILTETEYFSMREENRLPFYDLATGEMLRPY